jgi:hypothetical protein
MPNPRVFVSSTCYDLKYVRENLKFFIRSLGFEPILSEEGAVFYDPKLHAHDACLVEVPNCQIFVLVVGGRFGQEYRDSDKSITNVEFQAAVRAKVPIFALVERTVVEQYRVWQANREGVAVNADQLRYPAVDSTKIFAFVNEVQGQANNNALVPFSDFEEMREYLKQQWAGLMYRFLTSESEAQRTKNMFETLSGVTEKIEFLTRQLVETVGDPITKINVELYDFLFEHEVIRDLALWKLHPSPKKVLENETFDAFCDGLIKVYVSDDEDDFSPGSIVWGGPPYEIGQHRLESNRKVYTKVRNEVIERLKSKNIPVEAFLAYFNKAHRDPQLTVRA